MYDDVLVLYRGTSPSRPPKQVPGALGLLAGSHVQKPKRQQVSKACLTCKRAKAKCGTDRPCPRCVRIGAKDICIDFDDRPSTLAAQLRRERWL